MTIKYLWKITKGTIKYLRLKTFIKYCKNNHKYKWKSLFKEIRGHKWKDWKLARFSISLKKTNAWDHIYVDLEIRFVLFFYMVAVALVTCCFACSYMENRVIYTTWFFFLSKTKLLYFSLSLFGIKNGMVHNLSQVVASHDTCVN